jgi:hypothetical protein
VVVRSFAEIDRAVAQVLDPSSLEIFRTRISATENRAIFELPAMLEGVISTGGAQRPALKLGA